MCTNRETCNVQIGKNGVYKLGKLVRYKFGKLEVSKSGKLVVGIDKTLSKKLSKSCML